VKDALRYLQGTPDLGLFYSKNQDLSLIGYVDAGYLSDPHNGKFQTGLVFLHRGTVISWKSCKHTLIGMSTNHSEIIALYEDIRECGIEPIESPTIIYEDNVTCITQMQSGYVKSNVTKHIIPKLFYPHELQANWEISIL
jgi:hypothetical protein